jgi:hypothetical protein
MSTQVRSRVLLSLSAAVLILASSVAFAATENRHETVAHMTANAAGLSWQIGADNDRVMLTITGPNDFVYTHEFATARNVSVKMRDLGANLPDGSYTYEMRVIPRISPSVREQLAAARENNDDAAAEQIMAANGLKDPLVQSGSITIANGSFFPSDYVEPNGPNQGPDTKSAMSNKKIGSGGSADGTVSAQLHNAPVKALDVVTADDAIIQGSACIGLDCVVNESFGFDTIRLKENNTRIKFDDTSVGTCPANDWQLTANDACPGSNKFSIEDITGAKVPFTLTAGAPTNSIFVDSTGRLGLRTATPVLDIHVATSNTPAMRLEQNSSGGFTAQTWDVAGNEANFFVRDVTGGSRLPFRIRPGAPTSSIDIAASGFVGIGTASAAANLHVVTDNNEAVRLTRSSGGFSYLATYRGTTRDGLVGDLNDGWGLWTDGTVPLLFKTNGGNEHMRIDSGGTVTITGNLTVTGVKNFAMVDPGNSKNAIYYAALEGPEAGTYFRGTAKTVNGEAVIELPGYFGRITEKERMTVQITPVGAPNQLYVAERTPARLVIKAAKGSPDGEFDYFVQGVRKGYLDYVTERENNLPKADN